MPTESFWQSLLPARLRRLRGVRAQIWAVFLAGAALTLVTAALAIAAFTAADREAEQIATVSVPTLQKVTTLVERANQLAALAPLQRTITSTDELTSYLERGEGIYQQLIASSRELPDSVSLAQLKHYIESLYTSQLTMAQVSRGRLELSEQIKSSLQEADALSNALQLVLAPLAQTESSDRKRSRQVAAIQELRAETHLLLALLIQVGHESDRLDVNRLRTRLGDSLGRMALLIEALPSGDVRDIVLRTYNRLMALSTGTDNVPLLQLRRIEAEQQADTLLQTNLSLMDGLHQLQRKAQQQTTAEVNTSNRTMLNAFGWARAMLIALGLLAVAGALLLGWWFAGPLLGNRLVALAHSVEEMARGTLDTRFEDRKRDEIGRLAEALRQFQTLTRERARIENELSRLANYDPLTSLPNRHLLHLRAEELIAHSARSNGRFAVLFVDLDRFKPVNDSQGHEVGDFVLHEVAGRLQNSLRRTDMLGRLGGDEFVLFLEISHSVADAELVAEKVIGTLKEPFHFGEKSFFIGASIGISRYPDDGQDFAELLRKADAAMYNAKALGGNSVAVYRDEMNQAVSLRLELESALRGALDAEELEVWYQPKARLSDGSICGAEALLRWRRDGKLVSPAEFIPLAEETGLIVPIGAFVLRQAATDAVRWRELAGDRFTMAVNLSSRQLSVPDELTLALEEAVQRSGLPASALELEVTESLLMQNLSAASALLQSYRDKGHRIAIDDFGTGYASLSYVKNLPIDILKIDQTFVRGLPDDAGDLAVASALVGLGQALHFTIVAEGVETTEQREFLREHHCDIMQGYLLSKPLPAHEFERWLLQATEQAA